MALPSVLVLLLLYIFRRLPTRFSFHALRLAASRQQRGERGRREKTKRKKKTNEKGEKGNVKVAHEGVSELLGCTCGRPWPGLPFPCGPCGGAQKGSSALGLHKNQRYAQAKKCRHPLRKRGPVKAGVYAGLFLGGCGLHWGSCDPRATASFRWQNLRSMSNQKRLGISSLHLQAAEGRSLKLRAAEKGSRFY